MSRWTLSVRHREYGSWSINCRICDVCAVSHYFVLSSQAIFEESLCFSIPALLVTVSQLYSAANNVQMNGSADIKNCKMLRMCM